ncbi:MAG: NAD-binding protein [Candidatus Competibacteraceae bacterium]
MSGGRRLNGVELEAAIGIVTAYALAALLSWLPFLLYGVDPLAALFEVVSALSTPWPERRGRRSRAASAAENRAVRADMLMGGVCEGGLPHPDLPANLVGQNDGRSMRIALIGAGLTTVGAAEILIRRRAEVVIVEQDKERIEALVDTLDCGFIHGDGSKPAVLREVGPQHTDVLCCFTDNDHPTSWPVWSGARSAFAGFSPRSTTRNSNRSASNWA